MGDFGLDYRWNRFLAIFGIFLYSDVASVIADISVAKIENLEKIKIKNTQIINFKKKISENNQNSEKTENKSH